MDGVAKKIPRRARAHNIGEHNKYEFKMRKEVISTSDASHPMSQPQTVAFTTVSYLASGAGGLMRR